MSELIEKSIIDETVDRLVETYQPERIYLFGSYGWGEPDKNSDLDIVIIVDHIGEKYCKRSIKGYKALQGLKIPKDIIVYTEEEFEERAEQRGSLCYRIKEEGQVLYEAT